MVTRRLLILASVLALGGCTLDKQTAPAISGPSELGLSIALTVSPDIITQDGHSQSGINVIARDANSQPVAGLTLRADVAVNGAVVDFGTLSSRTMSTDSSGHAALTFTAPPPPPATGPDSTVIQFVVTPVDSNYQNAHSTTAELKLVRPGAPIGPPPSSLKAAFVFSPNSPKAGDTVQFDASASSTDSGAIVSYQWNFGDGSTAQGVKTSHVFTGDGDFTVVLTVTDNRGFTATSDPAAGKISIRAAVNPTAKFAVSPTAPVAGTVAFFNASESAASGGHKIVNYDWDFGDGSPHAGGVTTQHTYQQSGSYNVTLIVTDDAGNTGVVTTTVSIATSNPTASFTATTQTNPGDPITFDGSASSVAITGRTITKYEWDFGDGSTGAGVSVTHTYAGAGSKTVTLKVTDSAGQIGILARTIPVK